MELAYKFQKKVDEISDVICEYFNISEQEIISRNISEKVANARYFLWYILHYEMRLSAKKLSNIYFREPRNVFRGISKIKQGIKNQPYYKAIYEDLYRKVEPLIPEDIERFLENMEEKKKYLAC